MANRNNSRRRQPPVRPKWEAKPRETNNKTIYSIKNGKVIGVAIDNIQSMKKSVSDVTRGKFYAISTSETILKKIADSQQQNKIWYYKQENFPPRPISVPNDNNNNNNYSNTMPKSYKVYSIVKPNSIAEQSVVLTPSLIREAEEETPSVPNNVLPPKPLTPPAPQPPSPVPPQLEKMPEPLQFQEPEPPKTTVSLNF